MTRKQLSLLDSLIISAMMSESRIFTVRRFPDWTRLFWLVWLFIPVLFAGIIATFETLQADWIAGIGFILGLFLPLGVATG